MRYFLNYQNLGKGDDRPIDEGETIDIDIQKDGHAILPSVGDFVLLDNSGTDMASFRGRVRSRLFRYVKDSCMINIVLEESDDEWGALIKE